MANACRFQVELWLFIVVLEGDDSSTDKAACLILCGVAGQGAVFWDQHHLKGDIS